MNWGNKILLVYAVFVIGIGFMVFHSSAKKIDLVTPDYYEQELKYQETINAAHRANGLQSKPVLQVEHDSLSIFLPAEMNGKLVAADLLMYCIADRGKDVALHFETNKAVLKCRVPAINKGMHDIKVNWTAEGEAYYFEQKINLP